MTKKARQCTTFAMVWFLVATVVWGLLGYLMYRSSKDSQYNAANKAIFVALSGVFLVFGVIALLFMILTVVLVVGAIKKDRYDAAYNRGLLLGFIGLFFGLGAGSMLLMASRTHLKNHPKYLATLPVPTPICERCGQPVIFDKEVGGWYCPTCKIHLTKGVPKPPVQEKPILPPTPPPRPPGQQPVYQPYSPQAGTPPPPQAGYPPQQAPPPPQKPMGPPPAGYPPQQMPPPPPKPMGPPPAGYPPQQVPPPPPKPMAPPPGGYPPKPMAPPAGYPPQALPPNVRNITCNRCGKTFQWTVVDPNQRNIKCPWCNNDLTI